MKHYTVILTPRAERQLSALYVRVADDSGEARAEHYIDGIVADCLSSQRFRSAAQSATIFVQICAPKVTPAA